MTRSIVMFVFLATGLCSTPEPLTDCGIASTAGTFHFELALRTLVHPFGYVNNHSDGADASVWDETVS